MTIGPGDPLLLSPVPFLLLCQQLSPSQESMPTGEPLDVHFPTLLPL